MIETVADLQRKLRSLSNAVTMLDARAELDASEVRKVDAALASIRVVMMAVRDRAPKPSQGCAKCGRVDGLHALDCAELERDTDRPPAPDGERCQQAGCSMEASYSFVWPGRERAPICSEHYVLLERVVSALGLPYDSLDVQIAHPAPCGMVGSAGLLPRMWRDSYCRVCGALRGGGSPL